MRFCGQVENFKFRPLVYILYMKNYPVTVKNIHDYRIASKLYVIANECCACKVSSDLHEITFVFSSKSDKSCFKSMVNGLSIFSKYEI